MSEHNLNLPDGSNTTTISGHAMYEYEQEGEPAAKRTKKQGNNNNLDEPESTPQSRQIRLEQNRKAAKESRRRKKMMIAGRNIILTLCLC